MTGSSSTKRCPDCAEEVPTDAGFCPYCGFSFAAEPVEAESQELVEVEFEEEVPSAPPPPAPPVSASPLQPARASAPVGEVREGIVGSARTRLGEVVLGLSIAAMVLTAMFSVADIRALAWAEYTSGQLAKPALGYTIGAVIVAVVAAFGIRVLMPRLKDVGAAVRRGYRRRLRDEYGMTALYPRRGLKGSLIWTAILLIGLGGIVLYNINDVNNTAGLEPAFGLYLAAILVVVALIGVPLVWPWGSPETVYMDQEGNIHRSR
jgi:hypothetical protein